MLAASILSNIHFMTGTAIELPIALYLGPSGQSSAGLPRYGTRVQSSGNPCSLSHSRGVSLLTVSAALLVLFVMQTTGASFAAWEVIVPQLSASALVFVCVSVMQDTGPLLPVCAISQM